MAFGPAFVLLNIALWSLVLGVQVIESKLEKIPSRRKWSDSRPFPYFQDWHMATWGDWVGLSLIDYVAGYVLMSNFTLSIAAYALGFGFVASTIFHFRCLYARHRPDAGYPIHGHASLHGYAHLIYFFVQSSICGFLIVLLLQNMLLGYLLATALIGAVVYVASFSSDWYAGHFDTVSV